MRRAVYYTEMSNGWFSIVPIPYYNIFGHLNLFVLFFSLIAGLFLLALIIMTWRDMVFNARIERTNETVRVLGNIRSLVSKRVRNFGGEFLRNFNGEYRWVDVRILFDESLAPEEVVLSFREINQERQRQLQERKLFEDALEMARKNEESRQSFFNNMSHDMRTPLNAIIGLSDLANQHTEDPEKIRSYLKKINLL